MALVVVAVVVAFQPFFPPCGARVSRFPPVTMSASFDDKPRTGPQRVVRAVTFWSKVVPIQEGGTGTSTTDGTDTTGGGTDTTGSGTDGGTGNAGDATGAVDGTDGTATTGDSGVPAGESG